MQAPNESAPMPVNMQMLGDTKQMSATPITISNEDKKKRLIFTPSQPKLYYTNGDVIKFDIKGYEGTLLDWQSAKLRIKVKIREEINTPEDTTVSAKGFVYIGNHLDGVGLNHLNRGLFGLFKKIKITQGNFTIMDRDENDLISIAEKTIGSQAIEEDEISGFDNSDLIFAANPAAAYNLGVGKTPLGSIAAGVSAMSMDDAITVDIPLSTIITVPYLSDYNLFNPLHFELELNSEYRMFSPLITKWRIDHWKKFFIIVHDDTDTSVDRVLGVDEIHDGIKIVDAQFVFDSLLTQNYTLDNQEWHAVEMHKGELSRGFGTISSDEMIPIQKSSVKAFIPWSYIQGYGTINHWESKKAYDIWGCLHGLASSVITAKYVGRQVIKTSGVMGIDGRIKWDNATNLASSKPSVPLGTYSVGRFYEFPLSYSRVTVGGATFPQEYWYENKKEMYDEFLKEIHGLSISGTYTPPYLKYSAMGDECKSHETIVVATQVTDKTGDLAPTVYTFIGPERPSVKDKNIILNGFNVFALDTRVNFGQTLEDTDSWLTQSSTAFLPAIWFTKYVNNDKDIIGALDTENRQIVWHSKISYDYDKDNGILDRKLAYFLIYDTVSQLAGETGSVSKFD